MLFQSISSLWFALSLPCILLMYLLKRTYLDTQVSSSLLWRKVLREQEANRPWQKLRRQLLLLLQLAAALLLVLALMDPVLAGRSEPGRQVAIVLDVSASMTGANRGEASNRLETALARLAQWLEAESAASQATLIVTGEEPKIVASGSPRTIIEALGEIRPHFGPNDATAALTLADATLRNAESGEIVLVTDGLSSGFGEGNRFANPIRLMSVGGTADNVAIAAFGVRGGIAEGERATAVATLLNLGEHAVDGTFAIEAPHSGQRLFAAAFRLEPGEQRVIETEIEALPQMETTYYRAAIYAGSADGYAADDVAYAFQAVSGGQRRALLVGAGNLFLDKALQLAGVQTIQANPETFEPSGNLSNDIDWIVIDAGVPADKLDTAPWRHLLSAKPVWRIWSADAPPPGHTSVQPTAATPVVRDHPVVRYLTFDDVYIAKMAKTGSETELGDPVVTYGGIPAIYAGRTNGKPGIVMAFDLRDSDWPMRPEFPIFVSQAAEWMSGGIVSNLGRAVAGSRMDIQHQPAAVRSVWEPVEVPDGDRYGGLSAVDGEVDKQGALAGEQTVPDLPGLYRYVEIDGSGQMLGSRLLAVVADPSESRMAANGQNAVNHPIGASVEQAENGVPEQENPAIGNGTASYQSLVPWIAVLLLLLIAMEWEVYRRGTSVR
jgi:hypothetical protein